MSKEKIVSYSAVLYSDGSAKPRSPGYMGWSVHGYVHTDKPTTKGIGHPKVAATKTGYVDKQEKPEVVEVCKYYDYLGWTGTVNTSNAAEVNGLNQALKFANTIDNLKSVTVYSDSKYAVKGVTEYLPMWVENGWRKRDGSPSPDSDLWKSLLKTVDALSQKKAKITVQWVKGHGTNFGNIQADQLASIAGFRSIDTQQPGEVENISSADKYWKGETERHPMLGLRGMLFNTEQRTDDVGEYWMVSQVKSHEFIGRNEVAASYGYAKVTKPDPLLEVVRKRQREQSRDFVTLILARIDRVYDKAVCIALERFGDVVLRRRSKYNLNMHFINEDAMVQPSKKDDSVDKSMPITEELFPAKLALRCIESISTLKGLATVFQETNGDPKMQGTEIFDITKHYFDDTKVKGLDTKMFKKSIGVGDQSLNIRADAFGREIDFQLVFGIHILLRNNLKRLEGTDVKVWLVAQKLSDYAIRYYTVIKSNEDWSAWCGNNSNLRVFKDPLA